MPIADLLTKYWWVIAIIVALLLFWIYSRLDSYTKLSLRKFFSGQTLLIILFIVGWYFWNKYGKSAMVSDATRWMPIILLLYLTGIYYIGKLRYETQQLICPNFHGSFSKPPYKINGYYIFLIDSFNAGGLSWDFANRLCILREETCELFPFGAVSIASPTFVMQQEVNEDVWSFINSNKFCKGAVREVYYGWFDDISRVDWDFQQLKKLDDEKKEKKLYNLIKQELKVDNPKISTLLRQYKNVLKSVNKQTEWYDATVGSIEKGAEHQKRVKETYSPSQREENFKPESKEDY